MIISGGVNIYPQEIEKTLRQHPEVWDCAVVGVPDPQFGERPVAFVVPHKNSSVSPNDMHAQIVSYCKQHLGRLKQPQQIHLSDSLPYSPSGKVLRRQLRAQLEADSVTMRGQA